VHFGKVNEEDYVNERNDIGVTL